MAETCVPCGGSGKCIECHRELMKAFSACIYCEGTERCLSCGGTGELPRISDKDWARLCLVDRPMSDVEEAIFETFGRRVHRLGDLKVPSPEEIDAYFAKAWDHQRFCKLFAIRKQGVGSSTSSGHMDLFAVREERRIGLELWRAARKKTTGTM